MTKNEKEMLFDAEKSIFCCSCGSHAGGAGGRYDLLLQACGRRGWRGRSDAVHQRR